MIQFCCSVMSDSLRSHGLQHTKLFCPPLSPGVCSNSCPLYRWGCPTISSSEALFSHPQSFPASGIFPVSCPFASDDQNTEAEASVSVLPVNIQGWSPLRLMGLKSLAAQGTLKRLLQYHSLKASLLWCSAFFTVQLSQPYMTTGKTMPWLYCPLSAE